MLDKYDLYELCAQAPARDARFLRALHGGRPRILGEDFSGGGAIAKEWVRLFPGARGVAVDRDPEPLARLTGARGITVVRDDVRRATNNVDLIADLNFSICEIHSRRDLVAYLKHARSRLRSSRATGRGVFVCDIYGGSDAYYTGVITERKKGPSGERVVYEWEQRHADPLTGRVVNAMHFRVTPAEPAKRARRSRGSARKPYSIRDAFVYDWRLWSVPELREAMLDAGFAKTEVYPRFAEAIDDEGNMYVSPIEDPAEAGDSFSVYVVGRLSG
ncbi:MAG: hypothetical protein AB7G11_18025 [Phycisphaerales bacterium]